MTQIWTGMFQKDPQKKVVEVLRPFAMVSFCVVDKKEHLPGEGKLQPPSRGGNIGQNNSISNFLLELPKLSFI